MSLLTTYLVAHGVSVTWKHKTGNDGDDDIYTSSTITARAKAISRLMQRQHRSMKEVSMGMSP